MNSPSRQPADAAVGLGLRENLGQFALLILVNAFVGAMVGWHRQRLQPTNPNPCRRGEARERRRVCRTTSRRAERGIFHTSGNISATAPSHRERWTNNGRGFRRVKRLAPNLPMDGL